MEVPRLGAESELQLQAYTTAMASQILNPLSKARDWTPILTETMLGPKPLGHNRNSLWHFQAQLFCYFYATLGKENSSWKGHLFPTLQYP